MNIIIAFHIDCLFSIIENSWLIVIYLHHFECLCHWLCLLIPDEKSSLTISENCFYVKFYFTYPPFKITIFYRLSKFLLYCFLVGFYLHICCSFWMHMVYVFPIFPRIQCKEKITVIFHCTRDVNHMLQMHLNIFPLFCIHLLVLIRLDI